MKEYKGIAFGGGGVCGIAHIGVLEELEKRGAANFNTFAGSSAGSMVAVLRACNIPLKDIRDIIYEIDFRELSKSRFPFIGGIVRLFKKFGWNSTDNLDKWMGEILERFVGNKEITFKEIYETYGNYLIITATDIGYGRTVYYNPDTAPDMSVKTAVVQSSSLPLFFVTQSYEENLFTDGGMLDNFPIRSMYNRLDSEECIGIRLLSAEQIDTYVNSTKHIPNDLKEYIESLIKLLRKQAQRSHVEKDDWKRTVKVDCADIDSADFDLTDEQKDFLIEQGKLAAKKFLEKAK